jgi:hypothetical protein
MLLTTSQVSFTRELVAVQVDLSNVVKQINWRLQCEWLNTETDETWRWKLYITTDLEDPDLANFIDYDNLDAEIIMSWVVLSRDQENAYKDLCLSQFSAHITAALANQTQPQEIKNWQGRQWI